MDHSSQKNIHPIEDIHVVKIDERIKPNNNYHVQIPRESGLDLRFIQKLAKNEKDEYHHGNQIQDITGLNDRKYHVFEFSEQRYAERFASTVEGYVPVLENEPHSKGFYIKQKDVNIAMAAVAASLIAVAAFSYSLGADKDHSGWINPRKTSHQQEQVVKVNGKNVIKNESR